MLSRHSVQFLHQRVVISLDQSYMGQLTYLIRFIISSRLVTRKERGELLVVQLFLLLDGNDLLQSLLEVD